MMSGEKTSSNAVKDQHCPTKDVQDCAVENEQELNRLSIDAKQELHAFQAKKSRPGSERRSKACGLTKRRALLRRESPLKE